VPVSSSYKGAAARRRRRRGGAAAAARALCAPAAGGGRRLGGGGAAACLARRVLHRCRCACCRPLLPWRPAPSPGLLTGVARVSTYACLVPQSQLMVSCLPGRPCLHAQPRMEICHAAHSATLAGCPTHRPQHGQLACSAVHISKHAHDTGATQLRLDTQPMCMPEKHPGCRRGRPGRRAALLAHGVPAAAAAGRGGRRGRRAGPPGAGRARAARRRQGRPAAPRGQRAPRRQARLRDSRPSASISARAHVAVLPGLRSWFNTGVARMKAPRCATRHAHAHLLQT